MDKQRFLYSYLSTTIVVILADHLGLNLLFHVTKPIPALLCAWFAYSQMKANGYAGNIPRFIGMAFLMCSLGDLLLDIADCYPNPNGWFIFGMLSFALAHVGFLGSLISGVPVSTIKEKRHWWQLACATLVLVIGAEYFILNQEYFGEFVIPVLIYGVLLVIMAITASLRLMHHGKESYFAILSGALLFMTSDSLLGTVIFTDHFDRAEFLVLPLYFSAIGLLAYGFGKGKSGSYVF